MVVLTHSGPDLVKKPSLYLTKIKVTLQQPGSEWGLDHEPIAALLPSMSSLGHLLEQLLEEKENCYSRLSF